MEDSGSRQGGDFRVIEGPRLNQVAYSGKDKEDRPEVIVFSGGRHDGEKK
jgi:hypothetical protein